MNPNNRGPEGFDDETERRDGERRGAAGDALTVPQRQAFARTVELVAADHLLTVNPVDGSEIEPCPPGAHPGTPPRRSAEDRAARSRAARPPAPVGPAVTEPRPVLEREEERERLVRLLSRGRSVRVTGPAGSGRTALLDAVAADCAGLAPDGLVRLSGHRRTATDLLHELYAAVHDTSAYRPGRAELLAGVQGIGAVVVLDDIEFGGSALDELLTSTPECAFLIAATPDVAAPSPDSHLEEVFLGGLSRSACVEILQWAVQRPLEEQETSWAGDLWFESEGLPLRFVQAGALLRQRDVLWAEAAAADPATATADGTDGTGDAGAVEGADPATGETGTTPVPGAPLPGETPALGTPIIDGTPPLGTPLAEEISSLALPSVGQAAAPAALLGSRLSEAARETMRFALALGGACPHQAHLPALAGDTHADAAVGELIACGLLSTAGSHYRLAPGVALQLDAAGYEEGAGARALSAAQHYAWWAGHPSVTPERVAAESASILAALSSLVAQGEAGQPSAAVLLARTAAPAFAAAGAWGAWERALRHGQEAARVAGEVAEEAYFHHELGVLALCTGNLDRARAELEASIALRGALSDRRGAVAGRRALALVTDKARGFVAGVGRTGSDEESAEARTTAAGAPAASPTTARTALFKPGSDEAVTVVTQRAEPAAGATGSHRRSGLRRSVVGGTRRNVVAAGAGALLAAVLGTYVTIGMTSGDDGPADRVTSEQSANQDDGNNGLLPEDPSTSDSTNGPRKPSGSTSSGSPDGTTPGGSGDTAEEPSDSGKPSSSTPEETDDPPQTPTEPPSSTTSRPTTRPPSSTRPPSPSPTETETSPTPSDSGSGSSSQSATGTPSGSGPGSPTETSPTPTPTTSAPTTGTGSATP
ncbi:ATP-binding protein [Streptomyces sp. NPDC047108]|uniref:ATP-binding protein n=1 Tax=Streptomyces sp. NPDC047108 TaxID=3155025 RepID=UPI0033DD2190